eukprot:353287-Prymnesium_polylepis.1
MALAVTKHQRPSTCGKPGKPCREASAAPRSIRAMLSQHSKPTHWANALSRRRSRRCGRRLRSISSGSGAAPTAGCANCRRRWRGCSASRPSCARS